MDIHELNSELMTDDMARLIFSCCHPSLNIDARVALCLSVVCGLHTAEIARAFIVSEASMSQRLWRAKNKIKQAGIAYKVPEPQELPARMDAVLAVIYLIFNEGWLASSGTEPIRKELVSEAIRLAHLLDSSLKDAFQARALLALMLLQNARASARFDRDGRLIRLHEQDRTLWNREEIAQGVSLLRSVYEAGEGRSRYAVMAAIASVHAQAGDAEATDWNEIVVLYDVLQTLDPSAVVALNRAVALGERDGPERGLLEVDSLQESPTMQGYYLYHASRAEFLRRLGKGREAKTAYQTALSYCADNAERHFLEQQLARD